jgi:hypothetical protein
MKLHLLRKKTCNVPTLLGWTVIFLFIGAALMVGIFNLYPFLSKTEIVNARVMVVEGWMPAFVIEKSVKEFKRNNYSMAFATGIPIDKGYDYLKQRTFADLGATTLKSLGLDSSKVIAVPANATKVDRTYTSGLALKHWLDSSGLSVDAVNVVSIGPHSRRSQFLFQRALGKKISVGIISYSDESYDPNRWWMSSNGFRSVTDELTAFLYARIFFKGK